MLSMPFTNHKIQFIIGSIFLGQFVSLLDTCSAFFVKLLSLQGGCELPLLQYVITYAGIVLVATLSSGVFKPHDNSKPNLLQYSTMPLKNTAPMTKEEAFGKHVALKNANQENNSYEPRIFVDVTEENGCDLVFVPEEIIFPKPLEPKQNSIVFREEDLILPLTEYLNMLGGEVEQIGAVSGRPEIHYNGCKQYHEQHCDVNNLDTNISFLEKPCKDNTTTNINSTFASLQKSELDLCGFSTTHVGDACTHISIPLQAEALGNCSAHYKENQTNPCSSHQHPENAALNPFDAVNIDRKGKILQLVELSPRTQSRSTPMYIFPPANQNFAYEALQPKAAIMHNEVLKLGERKNNINFQEETGSTICCGEESFLDSDGSPIDKANDLYVHSNIASSTIYAQYRFQHESINDNKHYNIVDSLNHVKFLYESSSTDPTATSIVNDSQDVSFEQTCLSVKKQTCNHVSVVASVMHVLQRWSIILWNNLKNSIAVGTPGFYFLVAFLDVQGGTFSVIAFNHANLASTCLIDWGALLTAFILSVRFLNEKVTRYRILSLTLGLIGSMFILISDTFSNNSQQQILNFNAFNVELQSPSPLINKDPFSNISMISTDRIEAAIIDSQYFNSTVEKFLPNFIVDNNASCSECYCSDLNQENPITDFDFNKRINDDIYRSFVEERYCQLSMSVPNKENDVYVSATDTNNCLPPKINKLVVSLNETYEESQSSETNQLHLKRSAMLCIKKKRLFGDLMCVVSAIFLGTVTVLLEQLSDQGIPLHELLFKTFGTALVIAIVEFCLFEFNDAYSRIGAFSCKELLYLLGASFSMTAVYSLAPIVLRRNNSSFFNLSLLTSAALAVLLSAVLLDESFPLLYSVGLITIFGSLIIYYY